VFLLQCYQPFGHHKWRSRKPHINVSTFVWLLKSETDFSIVLFFLIRFLLSVVNENVSNLVRKNRQFSIFASFGAVFIFVDVIVKESL
jgi:hypothetical protein